MSELKNYILNTLNKTYDELETLSDTEVNTLTVYKHKECGKKIILIKSNNRNDGVFRALKCKDTGGLLPMIYEVATEEDALYVIEEYVEGITLFEKYKNASPTSDEIKGIMLSICDAMSILHSMKIIHRDIKPNNVMVRNDGTICLIDLSIAKTVNDGAKDTINLGTVGYAAPEQFGLSQSSPATDVYAFGVLVNQLVLGVHPTTQTPKGRLGRIIKKCTSTQIEDRYQNTDELEKAIKHI